MRNKSALSQRFGDSDRLLLVAATRGYGCGFHIHHLPIIVQDRVYVVLTGRLYSSIISLLPVEFTTSEGALHSFLLLANSYIISRGEYDRDSTEIITPVQIRHTEGIFKLASTVFAPLISKLLPLTVYEILCKAK
jgi:hypothetical protein